MPTPHNPLVDIIKDNAAGPARAAVDGQSVEQHSLKDQVEADRYLNSKEAVKKKGRLGLKITKAIPPGTTE